MYYFTIKVHYFPVFMRVWLTFSSPEVTLPDGRYIVCLNEEEAKRDQAVREQIEAKLRAKLKNGNVKDFIGNSEYKRYLSVENESASINEEKLKAAALYDGIYIIKTNTSLETEEVATAYRDLWQIERAFRDLKSTLEIEHPGDSTDVPLDRKKNLRAHCSLLFGFSRPNQVSKVIS